MTGLLAAVAAVVAGLCVHRSAHKAASQRLWWIAAAVAGTGASAVATGSPTPAAVAVAAGGLVAAATVDAAEGRIPTWVAYGTTATSVLLLVVHALGTGEWSLVLATGTSPHRSIGSRKNVFVSDDEEKDADEVESLSQARDRFQR